MSDDKKRRAFSTGWFETALAAASRWLIQTNEKIKGEVNLKRFLWHFSILLVIALGGWIAQIGLSHTPEKESEGLNLQIPRSEPTSQDLNQVSIQDLPAFAGGPEIKAPVGRWVDVHTVLPNRPRLDIIQYKVKVGDTLFGIAANFGLKPETILWGNYDVLQDNPHSLQPDQVLNIAPIDGTLHVWAEGEGLLGVAEFYQVGIEDIFDWPGNRLTPDINFEEPPIKPGALLIIPGGKREYVDWSAPRIPRSNPSVARILGPGYCGQIYDGPVGTGAFIWPAPNHYLSGYDYTPETNHFGIDIAGAEGHAIYAIDAGVVVYSGWHNGGYGNVIVLDHGNGWQSLYAHLSTINVGCGDGVFQGAVIGLMGTTGRSSGPHLHFEMRHDIYGRVNPWNFLP